MKTLYADVYFLVNFTVDLLALHFATRFSRVPTTPLRLAVGAMVGGIYALVLLFLPKSRLLFFFLGAVFFIMIIFLSSARVNLRRRCRLSVMFMLFELLLGGAVYYSYLTLERIVPDAIENTAPENKKLLVFALIILVVMGGIKLVSKMLAKSESEKKVTVKIKVGEREGSFDALVDSGNLLRDPVDLSPVMLIKEDEAVRLFPELSVFKSESPTIPDKLKKRVRFIPINMSGVRKLLFAVRPESAFLVFNKKEEQITVTLAIDKDGGTYGGYAALMPVSAIDNIKC